MSVVVRPTRDEFPGWLNWIVALALILIVLDSLSVLFDKSTTVWERVVGVAINLLFGMGILVVFVFLLGLLTKLVRSVRNHF